MATPIKILEIKGLDWLKGLSIQAGLALGGLFQNATNFDPFEKMGYLQPSLAPVTIDASTITTQLNYLASFADGADGFVVGIGNGTGVAKTKTLFSIKMSDSSVTDYSDQIDQNAGSQVDHFGIGIYKSRIIYGQSTTLRSNTLVPSTGNDENILSTSLTGSVLYPLVFVEGHDGNLYFNNSTGLGKILSVTDTTGNINNAFTITDSNMRTRDICNDGLFTIFIADTNANKVTTATSRCRIFFWDGIKSTADIIYDIPDSFVISCRYIDGKVLILGASGIWVCNSVTPPRLIFPLTSTQLPTSANAVSAKDNIMYWGAVGVGTKVHAYGSEIGEPILYTPYTSSSGVDLHIALVSSGSFFIVTTDNPSVFLLNSGSDRANATLTNTTLQLPQPFTLAFVKVVLKLPLATGQQITLNTFNGNGSVISATDVKTFTNVGAKQTLIFAPKSAANNFKKFEDIYVQINPARQTGDGANAIVQRVSVYAFPADDNSQFI